MITDYSTFHLQDILVIFVFSLASFDRIPTFLSKKIKTYYLCACVKKFTFADPHESIMVQ